VLLLLPQTVICFLSKPHGNLTTMATNCDSVTEKHEFRPIRSLQRSIIFPSECLPVALLVFPSFPWERNENLRPLRRNYQTAAINGTAKYHILLLLCPTILSLYYWYCKCGFIHSMPCPCRAHAVPLPCRALIHTCHAVLLPCSDSSVSFVKVRVVAGNIRTANPTV
jgi:hypothetical protein